MMKPITDPMEQARLIGVAIDAMETSIADAERASYAAEVLKTAWMKELGRLDSGELIPPGATVADVRTLLRVYMESAIQCADMAVRACDASVLTDRSCLQLLRQNDHLSMLISLGRTRTAAAPVALAVNSNRI